MLDGDIGKHCNLDICKQRDYLPFQCDLCKNWYCLDHRTYKSHECHVYKQQEQLRMQTEHITLKNEKKTRKKIGKGKKE